MVKRSAFINMLLKQQRIIKTNLSVIHIVSIILIIYLLIAGIVIYYKSQNLFDYKYRLDDNCLYYPCQFYMRINKNISTKALYLYISFDEFFVNHRKVATSISYKQLETGYSASYKTECKGYYTLDVLQLFFPDIKDYIPEDGIIKPCGLYPLLYTQC